MAVDHLRAGSPARWLAGLLAVLVAAVALAAPVGAEPSDALPTAVAPDGSADSWLLADLDTGRILASRDPHAPFAPASTIKVLLAIVVLDSVNLNARVVARPSSANVECSCAGVTPGRVYTARQLLDGLLLVSGNDAANTLADMLGGYRVAIAKMTAKAHQLGARSTRATSPSGLDAPGMQTTAHDMALIFRAALRNPAFAYIIRQPSAPFPTDSGVKTLSNQNELLTRYPGSVGGKTGFSDAAEHSYVAAAERNGRRLVAVLLHNPVGGQSNYEQAIRLFDWGFARG